MRIVWSGGGEDLRGGLRRDRRSAGRRGSQPERRAGLLTAFHKNPQAAPSYLYRQAIDWMNEAVAEQTAGGGSTIVSVWVRSGGLYWLSIGDSGLFLPCAAAACSGSFRSIITPRS